MFDQGLSGDYGTAVTGLAAQIGALFARAHVMGGEQPGWAEIEQVLTGGYALALEMESERWRIERRLSELVSTPQRLEGKAESRALKGRYAGLEGDIRWLRSLLEELQEYGTRVRDGDAAAPVPVGSVAC